jgi:ADP-heptose:LPS heptosyltransferase
VTLAGPVSPDLPRVLVIVTGGLGDAVLATAPLDELRRHHQRSEITVLTGRQNVRFFKHCPLVDRIDARWGALKPLDRVKFIWSLRQERYDMVYDLSLTEDTNALFAGLKPFPPHWSGTAMGCSHIYADRSHLSLHRLDRHAEQLMLCGIGPVDGYAPGTAPLPVLDWCENAVADRSRLEPKWHGIEGRFALLAPEGPPDEPVKRWPTARFGQMANTLADHGIAPIIVGTPAAADLAAEVRAIAPRALDLVARIDMFQFVALAPKASLAIGGEGDMAIMAAAAGAPTLAIINSNETSARKAAPRGLATVGLVARNFGSISIDQVLHAARAVAPDLI